MIVYGIKNCNTVKAALSWLKERDVKFEFHDFKTRGISKEKLSSWVSQTGWETLLNRKGTTWRQLDDDKKETVASASSAIELMLEKTSVIKRPVVEKNDKLVAIGFDETVYEKKFQK